MRIIGMCLLLMLENQMNQKGNSSDVYLGPVKCLNRFCEYNLNH